MLDYSALSKNPQHFRNFSGLEIEEFDALNIKIKEKSKEEFDALTGRHIFVHGGATFDQTDWNKTALDTRAFETLFNKIMLKLLGYSGYYINRSSTQWTNSTLT